MDLVERIAQAHRVSSTAIQNARSLSERRIESARMHLVDSADGMNDVIAFGSLARREATDQSDFDYLVVTTGLPAAASLDAMLSASDELRSVWSVEEGRNTSDVPPPGTSGLFGSTVSAFEIVDRIGLQEDSNHSLTRRMLLLEESVSLMDDVVYAKVVRAALSRYLEVSHAVRGRPPRFLLNDVLRYWRTVAVDYQAKARSNPKHSGLRFIKLVIPRKILIAGTLMTIMSCGLDFGCDATEEDLAVALARPPIERLVQFYEYAPATVQEAMAHVIGVLDAYLEKSSSLAWRTAVKRSTPSDESTHSPEFEDARERSKALQSSLETIFFDWPDLAPFARGLLVF